MRTFFFRQKTVGSYRSSWLYSHEILTKKNVVALEMRYYTDSLNLLSNFYIIQDDLDAIVDNLTEQVIIRESFETVYYEAGATVKTIL